MAIFGDRVSRHGWLAVWVSVAVGWSLRRSVALCVALWVGGSWLLGGRCGCVAMLVGCCM